MSKIVIIGIDGLDPFLLQEWKDDFSNIRRLFETVADISIESTFPPDSICAWTSIFTGENPAEHGLIESIDYLNSKKFRDDADKSSHFRGRTFWDIAGQSGRKVCVINAFLAYPAWNVNGSMVSGPVFEGGDISTYPDNILNKYDFPPIGGIVDFPDKDKLGEFISVTKENTLKLADAGIQMYRDTNPDLFFLTFLTLDRIKHFLWKYTDEDDRYYPGETPYKRSIKEFYAMFDNIVGKFMQEIPDDSALILLSDHGHGRRCTYCLNLNELLRRKGYLTISGKGFKGVAKQVIERAKVQTIAALSKHDLQDWIYKIAKLVPNRKALKKSTYLVDSDKSGVTLSNICGTNPFGGIDVRTDTAAEYEGLRGRVIDDLKKLNSELGFDVIKWVSRREEIYSGRFQNRLPDILFELDNDYGVGMDFFTGPVSPNYTHKKISGGHRRSGVLAVYSESGMYLSSERPHSVIDIKDYILKLLEV